MTISHWSENFNKLSLLNPAIEQAIGFVGTAPCSKKKGEHYGDTRKPFYRAVDLNEYSDI